MGKILKRNAKKHRKYRLEKWKPGITGLFCDRSFQALQQKTVDMRPANKDPVSKKKDKNPPSREHRDYFF